jgi:hypothetical protein
MVEAVTPEVTVVLREMADNTVRVMAWIEHK